MPIGDLKRIFPLLTDVNTKITSPIDNNYNCVAWVIGDTRRWWEPFGLILPTSSPPYHWPPELPQNKLPETFVRFFEMSGFEVVDNDVVEQGFDKIALYVKDGIFQHVARQTSDREWSSKLGAQEDVAHELRALEADGEYMYGTASIFMRKPRG